jgi:hypothetical protein
MAASVRVEVPIGDAQTAATANPTLAIPGTAAAGDIVFVTLNAGGTGTTLTTPSGWTLITGPNVFSGNNQWNLWKKLVSGDPGSTVTFGLSASVRCNGLGTIVQGGTDTGILFADLSDTGGGATTVTPTIASVPAGALYVVHFCWTRATASPAPDITVAAPYSQATGARTATNYGNSPEFSNEAAYEAAATAGTYGGDTLSTVNAGVGWNYAVAVPTGTVAASGSGSITLGGSPSAQAAPTAAGSITLAGTATGSKPASGSGSITLGGTATPLGPHAAGSITLGGAPSAQARPTAAGAITLAGSTAPKASASAVGGAISLAGSPAAKAVASAVSGAISLSGGPVQAAFRLQVWTGALWKPITPLVWDGATWRSDIAVTIVPSIG